ncbi:uncharacterized protein UV8b_01050 [Ustilaginoidea virens]|uniref:MHYT domain-containing protein n=1 Tax=Ustilaginoidea virens TaxID=1159556 RepID=A0A8E5HK10_USTVR|nr:uncharacterized protein UV8b_01050 [Ustilaginoidea virens]QUC16809.1 hypothetical protein UV8b_01050 [Ustilaginoidea virens]
MAASPDIEQLLQSYVGELVPYTFHPGFVCLSYTISLFGTGTTLELIRRRTSHRGYHNLLLLVGAAIAMGGIAIWSMHFIGNRAIYMLDGQAAFQIAYSASRTVLSLLVPILVLVLAFLGVSSNGRVRRGGIVIAGILSGCAICGMHYLGNASISNYAVSYNLGFLLGSVVIALLASTAALTLFFVFENTWSNAWWKRAGCAMGLAGAVSGMHWCAAVGTRYRLLSASPDEHGVSRQDSMIVVICLAISAGFVLTILAAYSTWVRRDYATKSQQVVVAAGVFDEKGRIMVSQDGYLPSEVVTDTYWPKSHDDIFSTSHPLFHWMFRASRNWATISKVLPRMALHISRLSQASNITGRGSVRLVGEDGVLVENYDIILQELFCIAADALAAKTKETLKGVGTLWDEILVTGHSLSLQGTPSSERSRLRSMEKLLSYSTAEKGAVPAQEDGRGTLMFLIRQVESKREVEKLEAAGFRFAEIHHVVGSVRSSMHIKSPDLESRLRNMAQQSRKTTMLSPGLHVGIFAVRARLDRCGGGFDVLVRKTAKNLLPAVALPNKGPLSPAESAFVQSLGGRTLDSVIAASEHCASSPTLETREFAGQLKAALCTLKSFLGDECFNEATLLPNNVQLPCSRINTTSDLKSASRCTLMAFQLVLPIHASLTASQCEFTALSLFKMRQVTYESSSDIVEFSHMVHRDMSSTALPEVAVVPPRFSLNLPSSSPYLTKTIDRVRSHRRHKTDPYLDTSKSQEGLSRTASSRLSSLCHGDEASIEDACKPPALSPGLNPDDQNGTSNDAAHSPPMQLHVYGGIMVSKQVSINFQETKEADTNPPQQSGSELIQLVPRSDSRCQAEKSFSATATGETVAPELANEAAFVDELLAMTMPKRFSQ